MSKLRFLRFGILQMLLAIALVAVFLWITTQAAMQTCEVYVHEIAGNFDNSQGPIEWTKVELEFLAPDDLTEDVAVVFLHPMPPPKDFETPNRIKFRYRSRSIFWLPSQDALQIALGRLRIRKKDVEEIIRERNWGCHD